MGKPKRKSAKSDFQDDDIDMDVPMATMASSAFSSANKKTKKKRRAAATKAHAGDAMTDDDGVVMATGQDAGVKNPQQHSDPLPPVPGVAKRGVPVFTSTGALPKRKKRGMSTAKQRKRKLELAEKAVTNLEKLSKRVEAETVTKGKKEQLKHLY